MILMKDIIREGNPDLKKKCKEVELPFSEEDKKILRDMLSYVIMSQNDQDAAKFGLRPAVGLAAPQIDVLKRMFAIVVHDLDGSFYVLPMVNPVITKRSKEMVYLPGGEGCLSVDRDTNGYLTPRHKSISVKGYLYHFDTNKLEAVHLNLKGYVSIVFQHEYDHLDGILYTDKMYQSLENVKPLWDESEEK